MKKLDKLILKSFLGPLLLTFAIAVFVLLMQFVWKYIDDLVGKGLDFSVIVQLLFYASATFVPMALPIAVLFASIMTMGNFGEKYELVAIKAGGVSINRVMMPMAFVALLLTGVAFYFANNVLPVAMLKYRTTLFDIQRKKPAVSIRPSEYYDEIDGYVIRVNSKSPDGKTLRDIIIYDHTQGINRTNVVVADHGTMQSTPDDKYLVFTLYDGYTYSEFSDGQNAQTRPFTSIEFDRQIITFDISDFAYTESDNRFFDGYYQMLNVSQLDSSAHSLEKELEKRFVEFKDVTLSKLEAYQRAKTLAAGGASVGESDQLAVADTVAADTAAVDSVVYLDVAKWMADTNVATRQQIITQARAIAFAVQNDIAMYNSITQSDQELINRHYIEWMRKFTLSVACLLLFLIGAPFGSIVRKGGLGMPLVASVIFFVMYYVIGMISEKSVRTSAMGPIGMWVSTFVFIPIGVLLTWQATTDSSLFDLATWRKWLHIKTKKPAESISEPAPESIADTDQAE